MNLQSFQASPREITFVRLLKSSMSYLPLVLCVISWLKCILLLHQNFGKFMDADFFYYSIYDRFIQRQQCACMLVCI